MTPSRTGGDRGHLELDRRFRELRRYPYRGRGTPPRDLTRVRCTSGTSKLTAFRQRDALLTTLASEGAWDVLAAIRDHRLTVAAVADARRRGEPLDVGAILPLWPAVDDALDAMGRERDTVRRYDTSLTKLRGADVLDEDAPLGALRDVEWREVRPVFASASDWNHLRRALSAVLTRVVGATSPLRAQVLAAIPLEKERARIPHADAATIRTLLATAPDHVRAPLLVLALTGARVGELGAAVRDVRHANAQTHTITCPAGKTGGHVYAIAPEAWAWVEATIPPRHAPAPAPDKRVSDSEWAKRLYRAWRDHTRAAGVPLTLHDLRHVHGQLAVDAGVPERDVQAQLGHTTAAQTRGYTMRAGQRTSAAAVARALLTPDDTTSGKKSGKVAATRRRHAS